MPSYLARPPYTDEYSERLDNAEHLQSGAFGAKKVILYNSSGSEISSLGLPSYDYVSMTISPATTETYVFKSGGASGTTVATVVIVYTDSTRADISTVTKT